MLYHVMATMAAASLAGLITYEVFYRAPYEYIKLQKNLRFKWVTLHDYVKELKYPLESYSVDTDDGYILTIHRIPFGVKKYSPLDCNSKTNSGGEKSKIPASIPTQNVHEHSKVYEFKTKVSGLLEAPSRRWRLKESKEHEQSRKRCERLPVVVVHGVLGCSGTMMVHNASALAYVLADAGFDTWLFNSRGTMYSRKHKTLNADLDPAFWDFSYHEMGYYDLKAMVDFVLANTGCDKIIMIGYSMGNSVGVAFLSDRPEYRDKVAQFFALAPAIYLNHMESTSVETIANLIINMQDVARLFKMHELFKMTWWTRWSSAAVCGLPGLRKTCTAVIRWTGGNSGNSIDSTKLVELMRYVPAGVSLPTLHHLAQQLKNSKCFGKFDYGAEKNKEVYGTEVAPCYDMSSISTPFCIYHGLHDSQVTVQDADRFADELPHVTCNIAVPFNHFDFMWSKLGKRLVYDEIAKKSDKISCEYRRKAQTL